MIEVNAFDKFVANLEKITADPTPLTTKLSNRWDQIARQKFEDEGHPHWPALAKSTIRERQAKGYTGKMMQRSGILKNSIVPFQNGMTAGVSTNIRYAAIHELGGEIYHGPRTRTLSFRTTRHKDSQLFRQSGHPNLVSFASAKHKSKISYNISQKGYTVTIPPRSFLALDDQDKEIIGQNIIEFIQEGI